MLKFISSFLGKRMLAAITVLIMVPSYSLAREVLLRAGTAIPMQLENSVTSKNAAVGQIVNFRVTQDVKVDGVTVIPANSIAKAQIVRAKKSGVFGSSGEIQLNINSVTAIDGTQVVLSGGTISDEGKNKFVLSLFLCFLIKGGQGELLSGLTCSPIVAGNTPIAVG